MEIIVYQQGPDNASNTKYYLSFKEDNRSNNANFSTIRLTVPMDKIDTVERTIRGLKGPRSEFNRRIKEILDQ